MFGLSDDTTAKVLTGLVSAVVGGFSVAAFNFFVGRKKLNAEITQITANTDHIKANTEKTMLETENLKRSIQDVNEKIFQNERVIYDGSRSVNGHDFKGQGERWYEQDERKLTGEGTSTITGNVIQILRKNTEGRYRVVLQKYIVDSKEHEFLPKDLTKDKRKIRVSCEARVDHGTHNLGSGHRTGVDSR